MAFIDVNGDGQVYILKSQLATRFTMSDNHWTEFSECFQVEFFDIQAWKFLKSPLDTCVIQQI